VCVGGVTSASEPRKTGQQTGQQKDGAGRHTEQNKETNQAERWGAGKPRQGGAVGSRVEQQGIFIEVRGHPSPGGAGAGAPLAWREGSKVQTEPVVLFHTPRGVNTPVNTPSTPRSTPGQHPGQHPGRPHPRSPQSPTPPPEPHPAPGAPPRHAWKVPALSVLGARVPLIGPRRLARTVESLCLDGCPSTFFFLFPDGGQSILLLADGWAKYFYGRKI
jgi:hypothetical protein